MHLRTIRVSDYARIVTMLDQWWGGRSVQLMLPRLFFCHFQDTSLIAEVENDVGGFLVGFVSPTESRTAYVHFIGVNPSHRRQCVGRSLYEHFFGIVRSRSCREVRSVTAPTNAMSIAFHERLGFVADPSNTKMNGVPYTADYDGPGEHRVLLSKKLI